MRLEAMPVSKLAAVRSGGGAPQEPSAFTSTGLPFVRAGSLPKLINGQGEGSLEKLEPRVAEEHGLSLFSAGTVLFAKSGMSATKGHVYRLKTSAYVVNHLAALVPHMTEDSEFLVRVLQRFSPTTLIKDEAYPSIRLGDIERMKVMVPPDPAGRQRIAEILDRADALRAKRRAALAQLDTLTQSIFLDMFGDPATNPKAWPREAVGNLASKFSDGPFGSNLKTDHYTDGGVRVVRLQNIGVEEFVDNDKAFISEEHFGALKKHECLPGDLLVGTLGDPNLRACIQPEWLLRALNKADCVQVRPDQRVANAEYLCALLNCPSTERMAQGLVLGQTRSRISMGRLRGLLVPRPPIELQNEFSLLVASARSVSVSLGSSSTALNALFESLQHRAFRGEL